MKTHAERQAPGPPSGRRSLCPSQNQLCGRQPWGSLLLAAALLAASPPAWALDLPALVALLAQRRNTEARFVEERFISGLDQPLRSSGTLSFQAPDRFSRQTLEPRPEAMSVVGNTVTLTRGGRTRQMTLDAVPEATALLEALRGTLNGDLALLQKFYTARVEGHASRWRLTLTPLAQRLGTQVRQLEIEGQQSDLKSVEVLLAGGDRSVMHIEPLRPAAAGAVAPAPNVAPTAAPKPAPAPAPTPAPTPAPAAAPAPVTTPRATPP